MARAKKVSSLPATLGKRMSIEIGARVYNYRTVHGLSQIDLARIAGVHRTLIARIEAGKPCREDSLVKVSLALWTSPGMLKRKYVNREPYRIDHRDDAVWIPTRASEIVRRGLLNLEALRQSEERRRIGLLGLATMFVRVLDVELPGGRVRGFVTESYGRDSSRTGPAQYIVYVLKGRVKFEYEDKEFFLSEGDAVTCWSDRPHNYEPLGGPDELPVVLLNFLVLHDEKELSRRGDFEVYYRMVEQL